MVCTTKIQAERVAGHGARKLDAQGYRLENVAGGLYEVSAPGQTKPYLVETDSEMIDFMGGGFCSCGFALENAEFGTCKHREWVLATLAEDARIAAEAEAYQEHLDMVAEAQMWEDYGDYLVSQH